MPGHQASYTSAERMDALLRKMCGEGVGGSLASLRAKWDSLDVLMESYKEVMDGQVPGALLLLFYRG